MALKHTVDMSARMRAVQALEMRTKGHTWGEIQVACGYKHAAEAYNAAKRLLERHEELAAEEYRKLETLRLDALFKADWDRACGYTETDRETGEVRVVEGDLFAQQMILKIMERRAKMLGLDIKPDQETFTAQVLIREIAAPVGDV